MAKTDLVGLPRALLALKTEDEMSQFLADILSHQELDQLENRWKAFQLILQGLPQREVSQALGLGIATVSRASRTIQHGNGSIKKLYDQL